MTDYRPENGDIIEDNDDFKPSPREAFHTEPQLCDYMLRKIHSSVPLMIKSSLISMGSGLFTTQDIEEGQEIYRSIPFMTAVDYDRNLDYLCYHCLKETEYVPGANLGMFQEQKCKACSGCRAIKFCSKECQKDAWVKYHKNECKILKEAPRLRSQHLLAYRLTFWRLQKRIPSELLKVISFLQTHFYDFVKDSKRGADITQVALAIQNATGGKASLVWLWKIVPALRINCVRIRTAGDHRSVGSAFDLVTAVINHSCDPNTFVFFDGQELKVRSLKRISAGEEITICYVDPTLGVASRQHLLEQEYHIKCSCRRCKSEAKDHEALIAQAGNMDAVLQTETNILALIREAVLLNQAPDNAVFSPHNEPVESRLNYVLGKAPSWPEFMDPLPAARMALGILYRQKGKYRQAAVNILKGQLVRRCRDGPEWVNDLFDTCIMLIQLGNLPPDSGVLKSNGKEMATIMDARTVAYGYLYVLFKAVSKVFGSGTLYTKMVFDMFGSVLTQKPGNCPGSEEFAKEFEEAQAKLLAWAGIPIQYALDLPQ